MRINEEVDALEVMGVRSIPYLVTCRVIAGLVAVIPLYAIGLLTSYVGSRLVVVYFYGPVRPAPTTTTSRCSCHRSTCSCRSSR